MSRTYLLDLESVALPEARLLEIMPDELKNPEMPENIANPFPPDLSKCPQYKDRKDPEAERTAWISKTKSAWAKDTEAAKAEWHLKASQARQTWIDDAALHAPRSSAKLIAIRDTAEGITSLMVIDATPEERKKIEAEKSWPCKVRFNFLTELAALNAFHDFTRDAIGKDGGHYIGYYISGYDFPYLLRRQMLTGAKVTRKLRRGARYWNEELYEDLDDTWKLGERELKIGGLDGLSRLLGVKRKTGDGEQFGDTWKRSPVEAVLYNLHEQDTIEQCARRMGVVE